MPPAPSYADLIARNLRAARAEADVSQGEVHKRMRDLGFTKWQPSTMSLAERGKRRLMAEEIFALAYVLDVTVTRLMSPTEDDHWVAFPSGKAIHAAHARQRVRSTGDDAIRWTDDDRAVFMPDVQRWEPADDSGEPDYFPPEQPVVAAIVICDRRVLVGRRNDGKPPWTFIAGEQEPGERPEDTAIREVKEEAGLRVQVGRRRRRADASENASPNDLPDRASDPRHGCISWATATSWLRSGGSIWLRRTTCCLACSGRCASTWSSSSTRAEALSDNGRSYGDYPGA